MPVVYARSTELVARERRKSYKSKKICVMMCVYVY